MTVAPFTSPSPVEPMNMRPLPPISSSDPAFTRTELVLVLAVLSLLVAIVLPALAHDRSRSVRIICANNLRQIGTALQVWGNDHGELPPWEVYVADGGSSDHVLKANAWLHYSFLSNELKYARVLLCPADSGRSAEDFSPSPTGGYLNANYRNRATSYFLTHASGIGPSGDFMIMAGDRNLRDVATEQCTEFGMAQAFYWNASKLGWNDSLHNEAGNLLRPDGRVDIFSSTELLNAAHAELPPNTSHGQIHLLPPR